MINLEPNDFTDDLAETPLDEGFEQMVDDNDPTVLTLVPEESISDSQQNKQQNTPGTTHVQQYYSFEGKP